MTMGDKKITIILLLCVATTLLASATLYYLGFSSGSAKNDVLQTSTTTPISAITTSSPESKTPTKPPVVVPSKDLHVLPTKICKVGGCSGEICGDKEMLSNCMYRPEYSCYKGAKCEVQPSGECGWTPSTELKACLNTHVDVAPTPK